MTFTGITCSESDIDQRSGANVSASYTDDMKTVAVLAGESMVNVVAGFNFSDVWATTLNDAVKYIITDIVASNVAIQAISYDMSGYTSLIEAANMINVLNNNVQRGLSIIREQTQEDFINSA